MGIFTNIEGLRLDDCTACDAPGALVEVWIYDAPEGTFEGVAECGHCKRVGPRVFRKTAGFARIAAAEAWNSANN